MGPSNTFWGILVLFLNIVIWFNWWCGTKLKEEGQANLQALRVEAVNHGYAEFIPNKDGTSVEFRWKEKVEKEK